MLCSQIRHATHAVNKITVVPQCSTDQHASLPYFYLYKLHTILVLYTALITVCNMCCTLCVGACYRSKGIVCIRVHG